MNKMIMSLGFVLASILAMPSLVDVVIADDATDAQTQVDTSIITPINPTMGIEKSIIEFSIPKDNSLPWGYVDGIVNNAVPDYPVVIQIYDNDDSIQGNSVGGVHFAQTDVNSDGSFEYRFRVVDMNQGSKINVFEGDYTVKIFKVVYLDDQLGAI